MNVAQHTATVMTYVKIFKSPSTLTESQLARDEGRRKQSV